MSALAAIKAILEADATLLATATGGVWDWDEAGRQGLSRTTTPAAFDADGIIKPCVLLRARAEVPDYMLADDANQYVSVRQVIEAWLYQDAGYATIGTMKLRIYRLLHAQRLVGTFQVLWQGDAQPSRDLQLDASVERSDYLAVQKRSV